MWSHRDAILTSQCYDITNLGCLLYHINMAASLYSMAFSDSRKGVQFGCYCSQWVKITCRERMGGLFHDLSLSDVGATFIMQSNLFQYLRCGSYIYNKIKHFFKLGESSLLHNA